MLMRDVSVMPGVMCTSCVHARTFVASSTISLASSVAPFGSRKTVFDRRPVFANGSVGVPMLDVAPLSTTAVGIDPLSTPRWSSLLSWRYVRCALLLLIAARDSVAYRLLSLLQRGERCNFVALCAYFLVVVSIVLRFCWSSGGPWKGRM